MKRITLILLFVYLFCSLSLFSEEIIKDSTNTQKEYYPLTKAELAAVAAKADSLQQANKIQFELIWQYKTQLDRFQFVAEQDSLLMDAKDRHIAELEDLNKLQKKTWGEKYDQYFYYTLGAGSIIFSSWVVNNIK